MVKRPLPSQVALATSLLLCSAAFAAPRASPSGTSRQAARGKRVKPAAGKAATPGSPAGAPAGSGGSGLGNAPSRAVLGQTAPTDAPVNEPTAGDEIAQIRVEGNKRVENEAIRRALTQREGQTFDPGRTADDLRALWALKYFSDIQLLVQRLPRGGIAYVVRVTERPAIRAVRLEGNKEISEEDLKEAMELKPFSILDLDGVRRSAKKIQEKYVEKGYFLAEVTHRLEPVPNSAEVDVVFVVREHSKVMVKEIRFLGVEKVPVAEIKDIMATKEGGILSFITGEGTYREELFQRDLAVVQAAYYDRGFINVKLEKPWVSLSPDKRYIFITLKVEEGDRYDVGKLDFSGDLLIGKEALRFKMSSSEGEVFNRTKLSRDILAITDLYYDQGYAYANISPVTRVHPEERTIDLTFDIQKGKQVSIERIEIVGNTKTRDQVIRRELRVYEGELFSGSGLRLSKERVTALGFFETVEVTHKPGSDESQVVVQVEIKEKPTGTFNVGLGFSNVESIIATAQVSQNNFLGWGQGVNASVQWSGLRSYIQLSFFDPHFFDTNYIFSADFFHVQADYIGFIRNSTGGDVSLGYHLFDEVMANLTYTQEHVQVEAGRSVGITRGLRSETFLDEQEAAEQGGVISSLRTSFTWDKRDNRLFPSKGFMLLGSVELSPPFLGATIQFWRYTADTRFYVPLPFGLVFKTKATFGLIQQLSATRDVPVSELYFLGGINSVRGYLLRSISPTERRGTELFPDAQVDESPVGGNKQLIFNFELEFPIFEKVGIRGVLFYDAGNAFAVDEPLFYSSRQDLFLGMYHAVGFGFRWFSPLGPLRFEWGIPLNRRPGDEPLLFEFTIGNFF